MPDFVPRLTSLATICPTWGVALVALMLLNGCGGDAGRTDNAAPPASAQAQRLATAPVISPTVIPAPYANYTISADAGGGYTVTDQAGSGGVQTYPSGTRLAFTDLTVELDNDGPAARVYRLYQAAFNRQPDLPGLGFWLNYTDGGASMVDAAAGFMMSKEFHDLYGNNPTPDQLIVKLYANVLHRAPEPAGYQFWLTAMANGTTPAQALDYFSDSPENRAQVAAQVANGVAYVPLRVPGVYLLAGDGISGGNTDGSAAQARFDAPNGLTMDSSGNLYTADSNSNRIRRITPQGQVTTLAGGANLSASVDGTGSAARFMSPRSITTDGAGVMYVLDGARIRKLTPAGVVTTYAVLPSAANAVVADRSGVLYLATQTGIAKIDTAGKISQLTPPYDEYGHRYTSLALDGSGNIYVSDGYAGVLYRVTPANIWTVVAGQPGVTGTVDGNGTTASLSAPTAMQFDTDGSLYFVDASQIRKFSPAGDVSTVAGALWGGLDGPVQSAGFRRPNGLVIDAAHNVYLADTGNNVIRVLSAAGQVRTLAGTAPLARSTDGSGAQARFQAIGGLAIDGAGRVLVADYSCVRAISAASQVSTVAGSCAVSGMSDGPAATARFGGLGGIAVDAAGTIYVSDQHVGVCKIAAAGTVGYFGGEGNPGTGVAALSWPSGIAVDNQGQVFVADADAGDMLDASLVRNLGANGRRLGDIKGLVGSYLTDVAFAPNGSLYATDFGNSRLLVGAHDAQRFQVLNSVGGVVGDAGDADGSIETAAFNSPTALAVDPDGNIYVADTMNHLIRKVTPAGVVTTVAGTREQSGTRLGALPGGLYQPSAIKVLDRKTLIVSSGNSVLKIVLP
ncbi:DUF4214 domain-containing protein [Rugamonas sp.]|uniref:DUF4214 domain-containing protein n=1 Tax=Rugamonas sp. TaxID=1926287 RepID=UPI0025DD8FE4|nr:DUF4214 domain-containing protein [Rugamonas sp.]